MANADKKLHPYSAAVCGLIFLAGCSGTPQSREAKHIEKARAALTAHDIKRAVIEYKVAAQNMPKDPEPLYQLGMTYLKLGAGASALEAFEKALKADPKHEPSRFQEAEFAISSGKQADVRQAADTIEAHLKLYPGDAEALGSLALAKAKLGDVAESTRLAVAAVARDPANTNPEKLIVAFYAARGDRTTARQLATEVSAQVPASPGAAVMNAQVALALNDTETADREIARALRIKHDFSPALELQMGRELRGGQTDQAEATVREIAKLPEKRAWAAYGRMLFAENKPDQAVAEFQRVLKEHADDSDIRNDLAQGLIRTGRTPQAESVLNETLKKDATNKAALLERAMLEIDRGDAEAASRDVNKLHELKVLVPQVTYQEARIFALRGDSIKQGDLLAETLKQNPRFLPARLDLSRLLLSSGQAKNALQILRDAPPADRNTVDYLYLLNAVNMESGNWDEVRTGVDRGLKSPVAGARFQYQDAILKARAKDYAGARAALEVSLVSSPNQEQSLALLSQVMRQQGQQDQYLKRLAELATKNGSRVPLQMLLARTRLESGDTTGARQALEAAKAAGEPVDADFEIARIEGASDPGKAMQRMQAVIQKHDNAKCRLLLAELELKTGAGPEAAVKEYAQALKLEPASVLAMNGMANVLANRQHKYDDAAFWAQKAVALTPNNPMVVDTLGWIFYRQGKYEDAVRLLAKSAKAFDRPSAHYHLAAAYARLGDRGRGRQEYDLAVKEDPKSVEREGVGSLFESK